MGSGGSCPGWKNSWTGCEKQAAQRGAKAAPAPETGLSVRPSNPGREVGEAGCSVLVFRAPTQRPLPLPPTPAGLAPAAGAPGGLYGDAQAPRGRHGLAVQRVEISEGSGRLGAAAGTAAAPVCRGLSLCCVKTQKRPLAVRQPYRAGGVGFRPLPRVPPHAPLCPAAPRRGRIRLPPSIHPHGKLRRASDSQRHFSSEPKAIWLGGGCFHSGPSPIPPGGESPRRFWSLTGAPRIGKGPYRRS